MTMPFIMGNNAITIMFEGNTHTLAKGDSNFQALYEAIKAKDWESIPDLLTPAKAFAAYCGELIAIVDGEILYNGSPLHNTLTTRILAMMEDGFDAQPMILFLEKLMQNPSMRAVNELYGFLEASALPITEDGDFLAYKKVRADFLDYYSGTMDNSVGQVLKMPRNMVNEDKNETCSYGLHFCSLNYLPHYHGGQGHVVIVKVNPADVVAVPADYNNSKGRACGYEIVGLHRSETQSAFSSPVASNKGEAVEGRFSTNASLKDILSTMALGVDFGTASRAALVNRLLESAASMSTLDEVRTIAQARVDGFDDGWEDRNVDLSRYTGNHLRDAVDYARYYFEGYDRARGRGDESATQVPQADEDNGYEDNDTFEGFSQEDEIKEMMEVPLPDYTEWRDYDLGFEHGLEEGKTAQMNQEDFSVDGAVDGDENYRIGYIEGYQQGYNG